MLASSLFSLFALSSATYVTETELDTFYVTVGPDGVAVPVPQSATSTASSVSTIVAQATPSFEASSFAALSQTFVIAVSTPTVVSLPIPSTSSWTSLTGQYIATGLEADILNYHNKVRAEHRVGSLTWNDTLAAYAQKYLNNSNCVFAHSGGPYGENIAIGYSAIDAAQDAWYNEENQYDYSAGQFGLNTGHFTQIVWKGSNQIGCTTIDCSGRTFLACEYSPAGNVIGAFTENVFPK